MNFLSLAFMQNIQKTVRKNSLVPGLLVLVLIALLGYKAYTLKVESKVRGMALKIVTVHASYNKFLRDNRLSSSIFSNEIKSNEMNLNNASKFIEVKNVDDLREFWDKLFDMIRAPDFPQNFELLERELPGYIPLGKYGKHLNLIMLPNDINEPPYKLTLGILIESQYGINLDKLIDDGSPVTGHMKILPALDKNKTFELNDECVLTNLKILESKNFVDCSYAYLF